jgi:hypothetical protein
VFPIFLKILQATKRWRSKKIFNGLHQPEDKKEQILNYRKTHHWWCAATWSIFLAQSRDNPEEWFLIELTCALVVRKRRGLSRQIWHAYPDRSINALVYHPQRTASSRLKVYTNIKLQDATPKIEDFVSLHEGSNNPKTITAAREASTLQDLNLRAEKKPSNSHRIFSGILDSLTALTLKMSQ